MADAGDADNNGSAAEERPEKIPPPQDSAPTPSEKQIAERGNQQTQENRERFIYSPFRDFFARPVTATISWLDGHGGTITAAATLAIAVLTYFVASNAYDQGTIFKRQLTIMQGQLDGIEADRRPWVYITRPIIEEPGLRVVQDGVVIAVTFGYKNVGKTPAKFADILGHMRVVNQAEYGKPSFAACEDRKRQPRKTLTEGVTIFPDQEGFIRSGFGMKSDELGRLRKEPGTALVIAGCIDYLFPTGPDHHETRFFYEIDRSGPNQTFLAIDIDHLPTGAGGLVIAINPGIAGDAD
jgi:hypothetical protein